VAQVVAALDPGSPMVRRRGEKAAGSCEIFRATMAPYENPNCKPRLYHFDARQGGYWMRRDDQPIKKDTTTTGYTFHFQISNRGGRKACSVKVQAPNIHDATAFFRQNWPTIESMARDGLANASHESSGIQLVMP
jgi:hypothetical protein